MCINRGKKQKTLLQMMPEEWLVSVDKISLKLDELFDVHWINQVWQNFVEMFEIKLSIGVQFFSNLLNGINRKAYCFCNLFNS